MEPRHYFLLSITLIIVASTLAYIAYPFQADELLCIEDRAGLGEAPGFVSGVAGVAAVEGYVELRGVVVGHGFVEEDGFRVPVLVVRTPEGRVYNVVMGGHLRGYLERHGGDTAIYTHPVYMVDRQVVVKGYKVSVNNTIVATAMQMECPGGMHGSPMGEWGQARGCMGHGWKDRGRG